MQVSRALVRRPASHAAVPLALQGAVATLRKGRH